MSDPFHSASEALGTVKQQFLGIQGPVLSLQVDSLLASVTFPEGLVPPIQGRMSGFSLNSPADPIPVDDTSPPELQGLADVRDSKSGSSPDRFVFPRSYLFSLFDPHDRETKRVTKRFKRASDLRDRFLATARTAGQAIGSIPLDRLKWIDPRSPLSSHRPTEAAGLWAKVLFDLAWQKRPGLSAERLRVFVRKNRPGERFEVPYEDDAATLRRRLNGTRQSARFAETCRQILEYYGDTLPDFFTSTIEDIVSASALAAGILADDLRRFAIEDRRTTHELFPDPAASRAVQRDSADAIVATAVDTEALKRARGQAFALLLYAAGVRRLARAFAGNGRQPKPEERELFIDQVKRLRESYFVVAPSGKPVRERDWEALRPFWERDGDLVTDAGETDRTAHDLVLHLALTTLGAAGALIASEERRDPWIWDAAMAKVAQLPVIDEHKLGVLLHREHDRGAKRWDAEHFCEDLRPPTPAQKAQQLRQWLKTLRENCTAAWRSLNGYANESQNITGRSGFLDTISDGVNTIRSDPFAAELAPAPPEGTETGRTLHTVKAAREVIGAVQRWVEEIEVRLAALEVGMGTAPPAGGAAGAVAVGEALVPAPMPPGPPGGNVEETKIPSSPLSVTDLAERIGEDRSAVEAFLRRFAKKDPDCRIESGTDRAAEPKWLYRPGIVWRPLTEWAEQRCRKRQS